MLFLLALAEPFMTDKSEKLGGAPPWVQEFLQRIADRDEVRDEKLRMADEMRDEKMHRALGDLSESLGLLGNSVSKLDKKVELLRGQLLTIRKNISTHNDRLETLENELHDVHTQINTLTDHVEILETEMKGLRSRC